jgi:hypothetical protein
LIEIAYSFEQATFIRKPPPLRKLDVWSSNGRNMIASSAHLLVKSLHYMNCKKV